MHSPLSSPSLRTITHLPRGSYFPAAAHISASASPRHSQSQTRQTQTQTQTQSNTVHGSPQPGIASPLNGCLKHSHSGHIPTSPILHPGLERRRTTRTSAVPLSPSVGAVRGLHNYRHGSVDTATENARRRPSFKIDLPPRGVPIDIQQQQQQHPKPHNLQYSQQQRPPHHQQQQHQHQQQQQQQHQQQQQQHQQHHLQHQYQQVPINSSRQGSTPFAERPPQLPISNSHTNTLFRDPFAVSSNPNPNPNTNPNTNTNAYPYSSQSQNQSQRGYIILQPAPAMISPGQTEFLHHPEMEMETEHETYETLVGLGYSLNKLRAPTPWIRGHAEDAEWLNEDDVSDITDLEGRLKGVNIA